MGEPWRSWATWVSCVSELREVMVCMGELCVSRG